MTDSYLSSLQEDSFEDDNQQKMPLPETYNQHLVMRNDPNNLNANYYYSVPKFRKTPLIILSYMFHLFPSLLVLIPVYVAESCGYFSETIENLMKTLGSSLFQTIFYMSWCLIFIMTLGVLHYNEDRIRNMWYSGIFYGILTIEMSILFVITALVLSSSSSEATNIASYHIGVVLFNLLIAFAIWFWISTILYCTRKDTFYFPIKIILVLLQLIGFIIVFLLYDEEIGLDPNKDMSSKSKTVAMIASSVSIGTITIGVLTHLFFTIRGKHRLFNQNRCPVLIDYYRYDSKISSFSYLVSFYNDLAWLLKKIVMICGRVYPNNRY